MRTFQRGNDTFSAGERDERIQTFIIGNRFILRATDVFQVAVLGPYARIIQPDAIECTGSGSPFSSCKV